MEKSAFAYSIKILLIGEDRKAEELLSDTLKAIGYDTSIVDSFDDAMKSMESANFDMVIADPANSSGSWQDFLIATRNKNGLPIIFITDPDDSEKSDYFEMGVDSILTRPFRIKKVEELIGTTLLDFDRSRIVIKTQTKTILVVDDDETILSILGNALKILGFKIVLNRSGEEALEKFEQGQYDLMITDYMMPGLSGKELINRVKEIKPDIPVIMITGYPLAYPPGVAKTEGIDAYLVKPFRINQLMDVISALLPDLKRESDKQ